MAFRTIGPVLLAAAFIGAAATPAAAEFFGCKDPHSKVSYSSAADRRAWEAFARSHHPGRVVQDSAPRQRSAGLFAPYSSRSERW